MFCPNCGQQNPDNANVCSNCGTRLSRPVAPTQNMQQPIMPMQNVNYQQIPQTAKKKSKKGVIIAVISVVLAIAIGVSTFFIIKNKKDKEVEVEANANTPEAVAEKAFKTRFENDPESFFKLFHKKYIEETAKMDGLSVSEFKKAWISRYEDSKEAFNEKYGKYTVTTKAVSCKKLDEEEFYHYQERLKNYYGLEISDVCEVEVEWTINGEKMNDSGTSTFKVAMIDSKWYLVE